MEEYITLEFEDGEKVEVEIIGTFDFNNKVLIALLNNINEEIFIYEYKELPTGQFELIDIKDEYEYMDALEEFEKIIDEL